MIWALAATLCAVASVGGAIDCTSISSMPTLRIEDHCYYWGKDTTFSYRWADAQETCRSMNYTSSSGDIVYGRLAMIANDTILQTILAINNQICFDQPMVGCMQSDPAQGEPAGGWHWVNSEDMAVGDVDEDLWAEGSPDNANSVCEDCCIIDTYNTGLDDISCDYIYQQFICDIYAPANASDAGYE